MPPSNLPCNSFSNCSHHCHVFPVYQIINVINSYFTVLNPAKRRWQCFILWHFLKNKISADYFSLPFSENSSLGMVTYRENQQKKSYGRETLRCTFAFIAMTRGYASPQWNQSNSQASVFCSFLSYPLGMSGKKKKDFIK